VEGVGVLKDEQINDVLVDFWMFENSAFFGEFTLLDEHNVIVSIIFEKLKKIIKVRKKLTR
jgi:hypothetical protein